MSRAPCCNKVGLKSGPWTAEEDMLLTKYIQSRGEGNWHNLPNAAGLLRCGKSCRLRWVNYLRPDLKRGNISEDEEDLIIKLHSLLGNRWSLIAGRIPGRTDNEIKNYWNTHLRKKLMNKGINPNNHQPLNQPLRKMGCHNSCSGHKSHSFEKKKKKNKKKLPELGSDYQGDTSESFVSTEDQLPWYYTHISKSETSVSGSAITSHSVSVSQTSSTSSTICCLELKTAPLAMPFSVQYRNCKNPNRLLECDYAADNNTLITNLFSADNEATCLEEQQNLHFLEEKLLQIDNLEDSFDWINENSWEFFS